MRLNMNKMSGDSRYGIMASFDLIAQMLPKWIEQCQIIHTRFTLIQFADIIIYSIFEWHKGVGMLAM